jgi:hypothetical protein
VSTTTQGLPVAFATVAAAAARADQEDVDRRALLLGLAWTAGVLAPVLSMAGGSLVLSRRPRRDPALSHPAPSLQEIR